MSFLLAGGQTGDFHLSHHTSNIPGSSSINFQISADNNGIINLANRFGLLKYDGMEWDFFPTHSSALSIAVNEQNVTFIGCIAGFGKMVYKDNQYQYEALLDNDTINDHFIETIVHEKVIYFLSPQNLFSYNTENKRVNHIASGDFINSYEYEGDLRINGGNGSTYLLNDDSLEALAISDKWGIVSASPSTIHTYGINLDGELFSLAGGKAKSLSLNKKLKEAKIGITGIEWVNDSILACSTLDEGVLFLNANQPDYLKIVNYHSGLPDNEIYDLYADKSGGIWVTHVSGLSRISPLFPVFNYSNFPELEGNLIDVQRINEDLWVNTSLGVYHFFQDTAFHDKVSVLKVIAPVRKRTETKSDSQTDDKKKKKHFLGLFNKKNKDERVANSIQKTTKTLFRNVFKKNTTKTSIEYKRKIEKIITGVSNEFIKVPGTDGKFKQFLTVGNSMIATSHSGIYEITKESAELVILDVARFAYEINSSNRLLISTEDGYLKSFERKNGEWIQLSSEAFEDVILNVYTDKVGRIWLAGTAKIYQATAGTSGYIVSNSFDVNNRFFDELGFWEKDDKLYLINSEGYFRLDETSKKVIKDNDLLARLGQPRQHIQDRNSVWVFNGRIWNLLKDDGTIEQHQYMTIFGDIQDVSFDSTLDGYWIITSENQLYSFLPPSDSNHEPDYSLFVKRLTNPTGEIQLLDKLSFEYDQNFLTVQMLKPDYQGILRPEYQYKLNGLHKEWSAWTHSSTIDYTYIPPGKYQLQVRVKDAFGNQEEATVLDFTVSAPYWQRSWFYLLQLFFLSILITITSRLNQDNPRNRLLKSALGILTLVVIIEFLQSIIGGYINIQSTPVLDFLIDVSTAILVFPLEWILRKFMLEGGLSRLKKTD